MMHLANTPSAKTGIQTSNSLPSSREKAPDLLRQKPDQICFGHKNKHAQDDHTNETEKTNWFRKIFHKVKHGFKPKTKVPEHHHTHNGEVCTNPQPHTHEHDGNWFHRTKEAIKNWFKNAYKHIREDLTNLHEWLKGKFPNAFKPRPSIREAKKQHKLDDYQAQCLQELSAKDTSQLSRA